jgi:hypothetical protein
MRREGVELVDASQPDSLIAQLAATQRNRVARRQLLANGLTTWQIRNRVRSGSLHPVLPGVYAVGSRAGGLRESLMAAWLYGDEESILSARGAASFWEMARFGSIDLTSPRNRRGTRNIVIHRGQIPTGDWIHRDNLKVTTPARTLLDLAPLVPLPRLAEAFNEAEVLDLISQRDITHLLTASPGRPGARALASLAGLELTPRRGRVRSPNEIRFRTFLEQRQGRWETPELNALVTVAGITYEVDALFRAARVAVEVDGRTTHDTALRFETDRERDRRLTAHGWRPVRVTSRHLGRPVELEEDFDLILGTAPP